MSNTLDIFKRKIKNRAKLRFIRILQFYVKQYLNLVFTDINIIFTYHYIATH